VMDDHMSITKNNIEAENFGCLKLMSKMIPVLVRTITKQTTNFDCSGMSR
jgi:hypothetical protein